MISLAASGEETIMNGTCPNLSNMTGPYRRDRSRKARCGRSPIKWCILPMIGSCHGHGGSRLACLRELNIAL
ncbi:hypothetical protein EE612_050306 [Oryza sativa]|nr:hypothetical protein EE612_050306 [Oryza sativa]